MVFQEGCSIILYLYILQFVSCILNQARTWFLKIVSVRTSVCVCVCVCVCSPPRLLITSDMIWIPYDWLNKFYNCYMATVVVIINGHGLCISMHLRH